MKVNRANLRNEKDWRSNKHYSAHMIRRRETTLFQAASLLSATFRWCLTGTPIQNHLEDVGSLLSFLRISQLENKAVFQNYIVRPFDDNVESASKNFAFLFDCICLRRPQELLHLPNITETYQYVDLTEDERLHYDNTLTAMSQFIRDKAKLNPAKRDAFGIFQAQLQLRLVCNHGTYQKPFTKNKHRDTKAEREEFLYTLGKNAESICSQCGIPIAVFDLIGDSYAHCRQCGHKLCQDCILQNSKGPENPENPTESTCPICNRISRYPDNCRTPPKKYLECDDGKEGYFNKIGVSSKIEALIRDLTDSGNGDTKR